MTDLREPRPVDGDLVDVGRSGWRTAAGWLLIGLLVGGLLGALIGLSRPSTASASTSLSVLPDPSVDSSASNTNTPNQDATSYIQTQLVILGSDRLTTQVQRALGLAAKPDVTATEVGQTYVIRLTAVSSSAGRAAAIVSTLGAQYKAQRERELTSSVAASTASTDKQLAVVSKALGGARTGAAQSGNLSPSQIALQTEYERLLSVRSRLALTQSQVGSLVMVLSPPSNSGGGISPTEKYLLAGALIGALLGLGSAIVARRALPRVRAIGDLAALNAEVLLPIVPRRPLLGRRGGVARPSTAARLLAARLGDFSAKRVPLIVFGATPEVGASFVAESLALALAERAQVLLVRSEAVTRPRHGSETVSDLADAVEPTALPGVWSLGEAQGLAATPVGRGALAASALVRPLKQAAADGWTVVVDAGALSESDLALQCMIAGGSATLVVGRGRTRPVDVLGAVDLLAARGLPLAGVVLNDLPGSIGGHLIDRLQRILGRAPAADANTSWQLTRPAPRRPTPVAAAPSAMQGSPVVFEPTLVEASTEPLVDDDPAAGLRAIGRRSG